MADARALRRGAAAATAPQDDVLPPGLFRVRDLSVLLPMLDELCVLALSGQELLAALENGVSMWPKLEGRFLAVSGVRFAFDGAKPAGSRVDVSSLRVNGEPLELSGRVYKVLTKNYLRSARRNAAPRRAMQRNATPRRAAPVDVAPCSARARAACQAARMALNASADARCWSIRSTSRSCPC